MAQIPDQLPAESLRDYRERLKAIDTGKLSTNEHYARATKLRRVTDAIKAEEQGGPPQQFKAAPGGRDIVAELILLYGEATAEQREEFINQVWEPAWGRSRPQP